MGPEDVSAYEKLEIQCLYVAATMLTWGVLLQEVSLSRDSTVIVLLMCRTTLKQRISKIVSTRSCAH